MLGLQALESGSPGISASRPRTFQGLRTLMRRIPQPQVWEDGNDLKPLVSSPRACGLGGINRLGARLRPVQSTRMRAWGRQRRGLFNDGGPAHAHAGLGTAFSVCSPTGWSSPRACGLGVMAPCNVIYHEVQPTRVRTWGRTIGQTARFSGPAHAHAGLGRRGGPVVRPDRSSPRACGLGRWRAKVR